MFRQQRMATEKPTSQDESRRRSRIALRFADIRESSHVWQSSRRTFLEPSLSRSAGEWRLMCRGELHVGLRDFDDDIPIVGGKRPKANAYAGEGLEFDVNFEVWRVLTDKCLSQKSW